MGPPAYPHDKTGLRPEPSTSRVSGEAFGASSQTSDLHGYQRYADMDDSGDDKSMPGFHNARVRNDDTHREHFSKPVYLKGIFSASSTSSKPLSFIRTDIVRVLEPLRVYYTEIKGGYRCLYGHSIQSYHRPEFDILIIKVPLLSLHGIQFKQLWGYEMSYKEIVYNILNDLRL